MSKVKYEKTIGIYFPTFGSGGARRHLTEILIRWDNHSEVNIIVFGPQELEKVIPRSPSIFFERLPALEKGFFFRFIWELIFSKRTFSRLSVLFVPLGSYVGLFRPFVAMSRNLLLYDNKEIARLELFSSKVITYLNRYIQLYTFDNAKKIIFISEFAKKTICEIKNSYKFKSVIINHGISIDFFYDMRKFKDISLYNRNNPFKILYVSSFYEYKNHKTLFECISRLFAKYPIKLILIGDFPSDKKEIEFKLLIKSYNNNFKHEVFQCLDKLDLNEVASFYKSSDLFVFPSSVENMPNILIEAMASSLPIASSNVQPMPEFLDNSGIYFNPLDVNSMEQAVLTLINDINLRQKVSNNARKKAAAYSWDKTANLTFRTLINSNQ